MAQVIDYDYIPEVSTLDALHNLTSDITTGYDPEIPGVNTFKINAEVSTYNFPEDSGLGIAGWSTDVKWTPAVGSISWTSGTINLPDGSQISISSGSANVTANTYLYVDMQDGTVYSTNSGIDAVGENKIMICAAFPNSGKNVTFKAFGCADQSSLTTGADIAARTIVASNIASGEITANEIASNTITANEIKSGAITSSKIDAGAVTASKISVSNLQAISADLGSITAGDITGVKVTASDGSTSIILDPSNGQITVKRGSTTVGTIKGAYNSIVGNILGLTGNNIGVDGTLWCLWKLRIPVGTDLYN